MLTYEKLLEAKRLLEENDHKIGEYCALCMLCGRAFDTPGKAFLHVAKDHYPGKFLDFQALRGYQTNEFKEEPNAT